MKISRKRQIVMEFITRHVSQEDITIEIDKEDYMPAIGDVVSLLYDEILRDSFWIDGAFKNIPLKVTGFSETGSAVVEPVINAGCDQFCPVKYLTEYKPKAKTYKPMFEVGESVFMPKECIEKIEKFYVNHNFFGKVLKIVKLNSGTSYYGITHTVYSEETEWNQDVPVAWLHSLTS